jgi:hypothetical protein
MKPIREPVRLAPSCTMPIYVPAVSRPRDVHRTVCLHGYKAGDGHARYDSSESEKLMRIARAVCTVPARPMAIDCTALDAVAPRMAIRQTDPIPINVRGR